MNFGLFLPATRGRGGFFLQDERPLADYWHLLQPPAGTGTLELSYKRRLYPISHSTNTLKRIKHLNSKAFTRHHHPTPSCIAPPPRCTPYKLCPPVPILNAALLFAHFFRLLSTSF